MKKASTLRGEVNGSVHPPMAIRTGNILRGLLTGWTQPAVTHSLVSSCLGDIPRRLQEIALSLTEMTQRTEPDFVHLASDLKGLYSCAAELGRTTSGHVNAVREALQSSCLTGPGGLAERSLDALEAGIVKAATSLQALTDVAGELGHLQTQGRQLGRIAMFLKASGCSFAVESARSEASRESFGTFVEELRQLAEKIGTLGQVIHDQSAAARLDLGLVNHGISADLDQLRELARQSDSTVRQTSGQMQQLLDAAWSALEQAVTQSRKITRHADDAVFHLQFGDILRQKLEHVIRAVAEAGQNLATSAASEGGQAAQILAIQAAQLEVMEAEIHGTRNQLSDAFNGLASETNRVLGNVRLIEGGSSSSGIRQNIFENLKTDLLALNTLQSQGQQLCRQTSETSQRAIDASAQLARHLGQVQEINREMHLQALNAIIKTVLLGDEGRTLGVLSTHVHTVFEESTGLVNETVAVLRQVTDHTDGFKSLARDESAAGGADLHQGLEQLARVHAEFQQTITSAVSLASQQEGRLHEARRRLDFLSELAGRVASFRRKITELCEALPKAVGMDAPADALSHRYTMESEREVHRRLSGQATQAASATTLVSAGAVTVSPPDNNMEFFDLPGPDAAASTQCSSSAAPATAAPPVGKKDESLGDNIDLF